MSSTLTGWLVIETESIRAVAMQDSKSREEASNTTNDRWRLYTMADGSLILAKSFQLKNIIFTVGVQSNGLYLFHCAGHPQRADAFLYLRPSKITIAGLCLIFDGAVFGAEVYSLWQLNKRELLNCIPGGKCAVTGLERVPGKQA